MDVDLILEAIFGEYRTKAIKEGKERIEVEKHLVCIRDQVEQSIKDATDDFIGRPNNDATRSALRDVINRSLNQFLDTDIKIDSIAYNDTAIDINMSYKPKDPASGIVMQGGVVAMSINPVYEIISRSL